MTGDHLRNGGDGETGAPAISPKLKAAAFLLGVLVLAGLVVLVVAGLPGAVGILLTLGGLVVMVALGSLLGGRGGRAGGGTMKG